MRLYKDYFAEEDLPFSYLDFKKEFDGVTLHDYLLAIGVLRNLSIKAQKKVLSSLLPHLKKVKLSFYGKEIGLIEEIGDSVFRYSFSVDGAHWSRWCVSEGAHGRGFLKFVDCVLGGEGAIVAFRYINKKLQIVGSSMGEIKKKLFPNLTYIQYPASYVYIWKNLGNKISDWSRVAKFREELEDKQKFINQKVVPRNERSRTISSNDILNPIEVPPRAPAEHPDRIYVEYSALENGVQYAIYTHEWEVAVVPMALFYDDDIGSPCMAFFEAETNVPLNKELISNHQESNIVISEKYEWIDSCCSSLKSRFSDSVVTWLGSGENYKSIDWSCLSGRIVRYLLLWGGGKSVEKALYMSRVCKRHNAKLTLQYCSPSLYWYAKDEVPQWSYGESEVSIQELADMQKSYVRCKGKVTLENEETLVIKKPSELKQESANQRYLIEPLFKTGEIVLLVAKQKVGKSWFALDLSMMLATKGAMGERLHAPLAEKVLYVDAEMPEIEVRSRIDKLKVNYSNVDAIEENLRIYSQKGQEKRLNLLDENDQRLLRKSLAGCKLLVLDNLGKLIPHRGERNEQVWGDFFEWLENIASEGVTILVVHHENKTGAHRGTGKITDDVGLVLSLKNVAATSENSNAIQVDIEDSRFLYGESCKSFVLEYGPDGRGVIVSEKSASSSPHSVGSGGQLVPSEEIERFGLKNVHVAILDTLRSGKQYVKRSEFTECYGEKLSSRSVQNALKYLCDCKLIIKEGKSKATRYLLPLQKQTNLQ